jgi:hypothetical protein
VARHLAKDVGRQAAARGVDLSSPRNRYALLRAAEKLKLDLFGGAEGGAEGGGEGGEGASSAAISIELVDPLPVEITLEMTAGEWAEAVQAPLKSLEVRADCM